MVVVALGSAGCDEKALQMARDARTILEAYEKELELTGAAEERAHQEQARIQEQAEREQVLASLEQERVERSRALALDFLEGESTVARWQEPLRDYTRIDYEIHRGLLLRELDSQLQFLERIQALEVSRQQVAALKKAFGALAEAPKLQDQLAGLGRYAQETRGEFDKKVCASLAEQITKKETASLTITDEAEKKAADVALQGLKAKQKSRGCQTGTS
jgi:hypothetical protein